MIPNQQTSIQLELQNAGFNVVTCGNCGTIIIHRTNQTKINCHKCLLTGEPCCFPDLNSDYIDLEGAIIRSDYGKRGGAIEINLYDLGYPDCKMTAYCNYLGGGVLGAIQSGYNEAIPINEEIKHIQIELKKYFATLIGVDYEQNKKLPKSAY